MRGVDISHYQDGLTIRQLQDAGMDFAVIKVTEGTGYTDPSAFEFYREAHEMGFPLGGFCYSHATTPEESAMEAGHIVETLRGWPMPCGVYLDIEEPRQLEFAYGDLLGIIQAWCSVLSGAGYTPGVYGSAGTLWSKVGPADLPSSCLVWVAKWSSIPPYIHCDLWQSSDSGQIPGYSGPVDTDEARSPRFEALVKLGYAAYNEQEVPPIPDSAAAMLADYLTTAEFREGFEKYLKGRQNDERAG